MKERATEQEDRLSRARHGQAGAAGAGTRLQSRHRLQSSRATGYRRQGHRPQSRNRAPRAGTELLEQAAGGYRSRHRTAETGNRPPRQEQATEAGSRSQEGRPTSSYDHWVAVRGKHLDSQMLSEGTNGGFGYLKSLDSDENEIWEVLGHVHGDSDDIFWRCQFW